MEKKIIYTIIELQSDGGWGYADFDSESYFDKIKAEKRQNKLNKEKPEYCGYYFELITSTIKG